VNMLLATVVKTFVRIAGRADDEERMQ